MGMRHGKCQVGKMMGMGKEGEGTRKAVEYRRHTFPPTVFTDMPRVVFSLCKICDFNGATVALAKRRTIIMIISSWSIGDEWGRRIRPMMYP